MMFIEGVYILPFQVPQGNALYCSCSRGDSEGNHVWPVLPADDSASLASLNQIWMRDEGCAAKGHPGYTKNGACSIFL